jgi:hypothetical protein
MESKIDLKKSIENYHSDSFYLISPDGFSIAHEKQNKENT